MCFGAEIASFCVTLMIKNLFCSSQKKKKINYKLYLLFYSELNNNPIIIIIVIIKPIDSFC